MNTGVDDKPKIKDLTFSFDFDFYIRECVRRRIYLDNRDNISDLEAAARTLTKCAECLAESESYQEGWDVGECEYQLLERVLSGRLEGFCCVQTRPSGETCCDYRTARLLEAACNYSLKYGYIISDMLMTVDELKICDVLVHKIINNNTVSEITSGITTSKKMQSHIFFGFSNDNIRPFGPNTPFWDKIKTNHSNTEQSIGDAIINGIGSVKYNFLIEDICATDFSIDASISRISLDIITLRAAIAALEIFKLYKTIHDKLLFFYGEDNEISKCFDCRHIYNHPMIFAHYCGMSTELIDKYDKILKLKFEYKEKDFYIAIKKRNKNLQSSIKKLKNRAIDAVNGLNAGPYRKSIAAESRFLGLYIWDIVNVEGKTVSDALQLFSDKYKEISGLEYKIIDPNSANLYLKVTEKYIKDGVFLPMVCVNSAEHTFSAHSD